MPTGSVKNDNFTNQISNPKVRSLGVSELLKNVAHQNNIMVGLNFCNIGLERTSWLEVLIHFTESYRRTAVWINLEGRKSSKIYLTSVA